MDMTSKKFTIYGVLSRACSHVYGTKGAIWLTTFTAMPLITLFSTMVSLILLFTLPPQTVAELKLEIAQLHYNLPSLHYFLATLAIKSGVAAAIAPLIAGLFMIGIATARRQTVTLGSGFHYFRHWIKIAIIYVIITLVSSSITFYCINFIHNVPLEPVYKVLLALIAFCIVLAYYALTFFSVPLAIDQKISIAAAFYTSFKKVRHHWVRMALLELCMALIPFVVLALFFVGLTSPSVWLKITSMSVSVLLGIWSLPYIFAVQGEAYHQLIDE